MVNKNRIKICSRKYSHLTKKSVKKIYHKYFFVKYEYFQKIYHKFALFDHRQAPDSVINIFPKWNKRSHVQFCLNLKISKTKYKQIKSSTWFFFTWLLYPKTDHKTNFLDLKDWSFDVFPRVAYVVKIKVFFYGLSLL